MNSGIYKIQNNVNGKTYIGQSIDVYSRWKRHQYELNRGKHHNKYLQGAWNTHGSDSFSFEVLELCSQEELDDKEKYWIDYHKSYKLQGYNLTDGGQNGQHVDTLPVRCITTDEVFQSTREAAEKYNLSVSGINSVLNGRCRYCGHRGNMPLIWQYESDAKNMTLQDKMRLFSNALMPVDNNKSRQVICLNNLQIFSSVTEAAKALSIGSSGDISLCCTGSLLSSGTINGAPAVWMYYEDFCKRNPSQGEIEEMILMGGHAHKKVVLLNTREIFNSILEADEAYQVGKTGISGCCRHRQKTAGKNNSGEPLVWVFYDDYINFSEEEINNILLDVIAINNDSVVRSVILLNDKTRYRSISEAAEKYSVPTTSIVRCCKCKSSYAGTDRLGNPLVWMYEDDYLVSSLEDINHKFALIEDAKKRKANSGSRKIILLNNLEIFETIKEAASKYNVLSENIRGCLNKEQTYAGEHDELGKLVWIHYDNYLLLSKEETQEMLAAPYQPKNSCFKKQIICVNTNEVFSSIKDAAVFGGVSPSNISGALARGGSSGKHPITKEKLYWKYYNE